MSILRTISLVAICVALQTLTGCDGKAVTAPQTLPTATNRYVLASSNQLPVAGSSVTITAQLVDSASNTPIPIAGRLVSWRDLGSAGGSFATGCMNIVAEGCHGSTSTTDVSGKATVVYVTSTKAGASHRILALDSAGSAGASNFMVTVAGPPVVYRLSVDKAVVLAGNTVSVSASLFDAYDNQIQSPGRVVSWSNSGAGGSFSAPTSSMDRAGNVSVTFRTSSIGGVTHVVTASDSSGVKGSSTGIQTIALAEGIVAQSVVVGSAHSCVLDRTGVASCWGWNAAGQLGNGLKNDFPAPVTVLGSFQFVSLAAGSSHTCGISNNGEASCWGRNSSGQLGNMNASESVLNATPVSGGLTFVALTAGDRHTCGIAPGGAAYCWGYNGSGQLGTGTTASSLGPVAVQGGLHFVALSAGANHTCGVAGNGRAYCWGDNQYGQVGDGSTTNSSVPTAVSGGLVFSVLSSGDLHTCGVAADGAAYCWGKNNFGQLGDGSLIDHLTPTRIPAAQKFTSMSAGFEHTCALATSGLAYCWGSNASGELGDGTVANRLTPVLVAGNLVFASIAAGGVKFEDYYTEIDASHTCAVTVDRTVYCWGYNAFGELGDNAASNATIAFIPFPTKVNGQR